MGWWSDTVGRCALHGEWNAEIAAACPRCVAAAGAPPSGPADDARAQLWARVFAAEFASSREEQRAQGVNGSWSAMSAAREAADAAVRQFDEHYLGGKR